MKTKSFKMTKEAYKELFCNSSPSMKEYFDKYFFLVPCDCGMVMCKGWELKYKEGVEIENK